MPFAGTQLRKDDYLSFDKRVRNSVRPPQTPQWFGYFSPDCARPLWPEPDRRPDMPQSYGSGTPYMNSAKTYKRSGIGVGRAGIYETVHTQEGCLKLPVEEEREQLYMPSSATLDRKSVV